MARDSSATDEHVYKSYTHDVRIIAVKDEYGPDKYRFEGPVHQGKTFDDPDTAELYAAVYFDVNSFREEKTGERGIPPAVARSGQDSLAAYRVTQSGTSIEGVATSWGITPESVATYLSRVRSRASDRVRELREGRET